MPIQNLHKNTSNNKGVIQTHTVVCRFLLLFSLLLLNIPILAGSSKIAISIIMFIVYFRSFLTLNVSQNVGLIALLRMRGIEKTTRKCLFNFKLPNRSQKNLGKM